MTNETETQKETRPVATVKTNEVSEKQKLENQKEFASRLLPFSKPDFDISKMPPRPWVGERVKSLSGEVAREIHIHSHYEENGVKHCILVAIVPNEHVAAFILKHINTAY